MTGVPALQSLTLTAFRGSSETFKLSFEKNKKLTLIYGENGTGKTTICDAFEFLAADRIGSLDNRGLGTSVRKYWRTVGKPTQDFVVELATSDGACSGKLAGNQNTVLSGITPPRVELLRQRQILDLIEAQPAKRYDAIKRFIDIEAFERSEEALRQQGKSLVGDLASAKQAELQSLTELQGSFDIAGGPDGINPVEWANQKLAAPPSGLDDDITALCKLRTAYDKLKAFPDSLRARQDSAQSAKLAADNAEQALANALASVDRAAAARQQVLEAGAHFLESHPDADRCPLCESSERAEGLASAVKATLAHLGELTVANKHKQNAQKDLDRAQAALQQVAKDYADAVVALDATYAARDWQGRIQCITSSAPEVVTDLPTWLAANDPIAVSWATVESEWRGESKFLGQLKSAVERYEVNAQRVVELEALIPKLEQALEICVDERQKFTDGIITDIARKVGELYEKVHPGEGLDKIALQLDPKKRASLNLEAQFAGQDAPPGAYFSQSHLDTLGLCVFLALALRDQPERTVLILDDVLGSIDEPHVGRVIEMIYEVSKSFQHSIVTTHYRPWREKYKWGWLKPDMPCQFVELAGWNMNGGIKAIGSIPEVDLLRVRLAEPSIDIQSVCSKAGVILEATLDYLTQKYECAVPRRFGAAYTLGDLLPAIKGKLKDNLVVEIRDKSADPLAPPTATTSLKPIFEELSRIVQVRNAAGAHFKDISFELLESDAIGFAQQVLALVDALVCPDHGWPSNSNSGSYWRNSGDTRRLHPLKKPA